MSTTGSNDRPNPRGSYAEIDREMGYARATNTQPFRQERERALSGQVMDQIMDYARGYGGGVEVVNNLGRAMRDNPLPVLLIGAGVAWLAASRAMHSGGRSYADLDHDDDGYEQVRRSRSSGASYGSMEGGGERASRGSSSSGGYASAAGSTVSDVASTVSEAASSVYSGVSQAVGQAASAIGGAVSSAGSTASSGAYGAVGYASRAGSGAYGSVRRSFLDIAEEQPIVLGAVGLALGAAIGAALPSTRIEDEYLGETRDELARRAREAGEEGYEKAKLVAQRAVEEARGEAEEQGLTPGSITETVRGLGDRFGAVAEAAKEGALSEAEKQNLTSKS